MIGNQHRYTEVQTSSVHELEVVSLSPIHAESLSTTSNHAQEVQLSPKQGTVLSGYFNITNTILGSSVLGLPYAYSHTGWVLGTLLILAGAASSAFALHTLSLCALRLNAETDKKKSVSKGGESSAVDGATFYSVGKATLPSLTLLIDVAIALKCFGVAISYLIVVGDLMPLVMTQASATPFWKARELWVVLGWLGAAPFAVLKDLTSLSTISSLAIIFVAVFALLVVCYGTGIGGMDPCDSNGSGASGSGGSGSSDSCKGETHWAILDLQSCKVLPIFVFGFTCQQVSGHVPQSSSSLLCSLVRVSSLIFIIVHFFRIYSPCATKCRKQPSRK